MRTVGRSIVIAVFAVLLFGLMGTAQPAQADGRQVWAYYFGWYTGDSWGDSRLIDHPANPYDSRDAGTIGGQIDQAKGAGIDAFIMSWYGPKNNNLTSQVFNTLLDQANQKGFHAAVSVDMADPGYNSSVDEVIQSLQYAIGDRANQPAYLRYNGKPVIYFWNEARYSVADWQNIRSQTDPNHNTIWVAEGTSTKFLPTFDGLYLFNTAWSTNPASTAAQWMSNTMKAGGTFYTPTVLPGWDESHISGRTNPTAPRGRDNGQFLTNSWNGAASSSADVILIVSWNEYLENSYIEPSQNFGTQSLDVLRPLIAAWKGGASPSASQPQPAPAAGPTQQVLTPNVVVNVRSGAGADNPSLGKIHPGDTYAVQGSSNGWYQISFNGAAGWVSAQFVTVSQGTVSSAPSGAPTGVTFTISNNVRMRSTPSTDGQSLATIPYKTVLDAIGRNADSSWVQVNFQGGSGWVSAKYGTLSADIQSLPVTG